MNSIESWVDLGNPSLRANAIRYSPLVWPQGRSVQLPSTAGVQGSQSILGLALSRRTRRQFAPIDIDVFGALLWLTCRVQELGGTELGFPLTLRPCPSAGAIHPIHLLVVFPGDERWYRYDAIGHSLVEVPSGLDVGEVVGAMHEVLSAPDATLLILAAEPGMTAAKYESSASLVWRDAGVMLGFLAIAAQALALSYCPLGVTGEPWISRLVDQPGLVGVGAAFVGSAT